MNAFPVRILLAGLVLTVLGATSGCATTFLYDRADRFANRWVGSYLDLDAPRQERLDAALAELHEWHRREQLPVYVDWLRAVAGRLEDETPWSGDELRDRGMALGVYWRVVAEAAMPMLTGIGADLEDAQVAGLLASLREERDKEFSAAERRTASWHQARRARSMERFLRRWIGSLSAEQRAAVAAWSEALEPSRAASFENRGGWIDALEEALANRDDHGALEHSARGLFVTPSGRWSTGYRALVERNSARTRTFMAEFLNRLDDRQRARAVGRIEKLAAELEQLARAGR